MRAMIFAAGLGTRLRPLTDNMPKALVPLNGKTLLQYQIEKLQAAGITEIIINVHHFPEQIISYLRDHDNFGCNIAISDESEMLLETGGGLRKAKDFLASSNEPFLVCNVDILSNIDIPTLIAAHRPEDIATVVVSPRDTQRYLLFDEHQRMQGWTNIKTGEVRPAEFNIQHSAFNIQRLAFSGMQILSPRIFEKMDAFPEKFSLIDLYVSLCQREQIRAFVPTDYRMMDVGKIDHIQEAEAFAKQLDEASPQEQSKKMQQTVEHIADYGKHYSEDNLWSKLQKVAKKAGKPIISLVLTLYYVLVSVDVPAKYKTLIIGALGYFILPIDLLPDMIVGLGYTDDLTALLAAHAAVKKNITPEIEQQVALKLKEWGME